MPIIRIDYDNEKISNKKIKNLCKAIRSIVINQTTIQDVFVYGNSSEIKINIAPVEIFIEMSKQKIEDEDDLLNRIKTDIQQRKKNNKFDIPINLTLIPMKRKIAINI